MFKIYIYGIYIYIYIPLYMTFAGIVFISPKILIVSTANAVQGHAGVTHLSPMEAREVSDPGRVLCVFGRSPEGLPHKVRRDD